jgi:hypothetical protein
LNTLPLSPYSPETWREIAAKVLIPRDRVGVGVGNQQVTIGGKFESLFRFESIPIGSGSIQTATPKGARRRTSIWTSHHKEADLQFQVPQGSRKPHFPVQAGAL